MALALRAITVLQEDVATAGDVPPELLLRLFRECDAHLLNGVEGVLLAHPSGLAAAVWLPTLRAELHDLESDRRRAATLVLPAVRGDDEAVLALLREALRDEAVRDAGIEALGRMARLAERVVPLLEAEVGRRPHAAIEALGRMALEAPHARGALSRLTSAEDPEIRAAAVDVLSQVDEAYAAR